MAGTSQPIPAARVNQSDCLFQPHRRRHSHSLPVVSARAGPNEPTTNSTRAQPPSPRLMSRRRKHRDPAPPTGAKERRPSFSPSRARKGPQDTSVHSPIPPHPNNQSAHHRRRKTGGRRPAAPLVSLETTAPSSAPSTGPGPIRAALVTTTRPLHVTAAVTGASDLHYQARRSPTRTVHSLAIQHLRHH